MSLPAEKLSKLKQMIHDHLDRMDVHGKIREYVSESMRDREDDAGGVSEEELIRAMQEKGIVDDVMSGLEFKRTRQNAEMSQNITYPREKGEKSRRKFANVQEDPTECKKYESKASLLLISLFLATALVTKMKSLDFMQ